MHFPVWRTFFNNALRVYANREVIWYFGRTPILIVLAIDIAWVIYFLAVARETFPESITADTSVAAVWQVPLTQFSLQIIGLVIQVPLFISWIRFCAAGDAAARMRPRFALGAAEWRFIGRSILFFLAVFGVMLAIMLVLLIGGGVGGGIAALIVAIANVPEAIVAVAGAIAGSVFIGVIYGVMFALYVRWPATFIPLAFDQPLNLKLAWGVTKGVSWRLAGMYFASMLLFMPVILGMFAWMGSLPDPNHAFRDFWVFQIVTPLVNFPFYLLFTLTLTGVYSDVWKLDRGRAAWPVPEFPLTPMTSQTPATP